MVTALKAGRQPKTYVVNILRHKHAPPREGTSQAMLYGDGLVQLKVLFNGNNNPVQYIIRYKGNPPARNTTFWATIFYRVHDGQYHARAYTIVYQDIYVRLLKFGKTNPDYIFVTLSPTQEDRAGDKRFSTIADTHVIERDDGPVNVITGAEDDG